MPNPPRAKKIPRIVTTPHGVRADDYGWLRGRTNPAVLEYLKQENIYTEETMRDTTELREKLFSEMKARLQETDATVPAKLDDYYYYSRTETGQQYEIHCRKKGTLAAPEEILLDLNVLAKDSAADYLRLGALSVSPNHRYLAYSLDTAGAESFTLRIKDLNTNQLLATEIKNTYYTLAWASDSQSFFYTTLDEIKRPSRVYRHDLASPAAADTLVYEETDRRFNVWLRAARSRRLIFIDLESNDTTECRFLDPAQPLQPSRLVAPRRAGIEYHPYHHPAGDTLYILTNDGAPNFRLLQTTVAAPDCDQWRELVPTRVAAILDDLEVFQTHLVLTVREEARRRFEIINLSDKPNQSPSRLDFVEPLYAVRAEINLEFTAESFRFCYSSPVTPDSVYDYNFLTGEKKLLKQQTLPSGYDAGQYGSERLWAPAPDGVRIPLSLVYRRPRAPGQLRPLVLYGYGAYETVIETGFSAALLPLLDRGVIFAVAHIRGGGELGRSWYEAGRFLNKPNTFTDFITSAEYLIRERWTSADRLAALGRSAGGLLIGAAANRRPDLFRTMIADVPFVDALNTMLDPSLPLTEFEYGEWGNPREKKFYDCLAAYSPYDNVRAQNYPNLLVTAGWNDPRVAYWEPAKWVAKLRTTKTDQNLLLLKTNFGAGHAGASGRYDTLRELAFEYAFILKTLGLE